MFQSEGHPNRNRSDWRFQQNADETSFSSTISPVSPLELVQMEGMKSHIGQTANHRSDTGRYLGSPHRLSDQPPTTPVRSRSDNKTLRTQTYPIQNDQESDSTSSSDSTHCHSNGATRKSPRHSFQKKWPSTPPGSTARRSRQKTLQHPSSEKTSRRRFHVHKSRSWGDLASSASSLGAASDPSIHSPTRRRRIKAATRAVSHTSPRTSPRFIASTGESRRPTPFSLGYSPGSSMRTRSSIDNRESPLMVSPKSARRKLHRDRLDAEAATEARKTRQRISVRQRRAQMKAIVVMQRYVRRFLVRLKYRNQIIARDYRHYAQERRLRVESQQSQFRLMKQKLRVIEETTQSELREMRRKFEAEKMALGAAMKTIVRSNMEREIHIKNHGSLSIMEQLVSVEQEEEELQKTKVGLELINAALRDENEKFYEANQSMESMCASLEEFVLRKEEEREELLAQRVMIEKVSLPKVKKELAVVKGFGMIETATRRLYREGMYQQAEGIKNCEQQNLMLYLDVMDLITECEQDLGRDTLELKEYWNDRIYDSADELDLTSDDDIEL